MNPKSLHPRSIIALLSTVVVLALVTLVCVIWFFERAYFYQSNAANPSQSDSAATVIWEKRKTDAVTAQDGRIVFSAEPLAQAVERFAAASGRKIAVAPEAAAFVLYGEWSLNDFDGFLATLPKLFPVQVERASDGRTRIVRIKVKEQTAED